MNVRDPFVYDELLLNELQSTRHQKFNANT